MKKRKKTSKLIIYLLILTTISTLFCINISYADNQDAKAVTVDDFLSKPITNQPSAEKPDANKESKLNLVKNLPQDDWKVILSNIIKTILGITGSLAFIAFTVGGVMMVTSQGNEEQITKGKGIILYSILALIIIATSYAVILGITQLNLIP